MNQLQDILAAGQRYLLARRAVAQRRHDITRVRRLGVVGTPIIDRLEALALGENVRRIADAIVYRSGPVPCRDAADPPLQAPWAGICIVGSGSTSIPNCARPSYPKKVARSVSAGGPSRCQACRTSALSRATPIDTMAQFKIKS